MYACNETAHVNACILMSASHLIVDLIQFLMPQIMKTAYEVNDESY